MTDSENWVRMPQVGVVGKLAEEFIALESLSREMARVATLLRELLARPSLDNTDESDPVDTALWNSAVVGYARCYKQGRRKGIVNQIPIPADDKTFHDWVLMIRDEHVAHLGQNAVGEQAAVSLALDAVGPRRVDNVLLLFAQLDHPLRPAILAFLGVATRAQERFSLAASAAGQRLLTVAQSLPVDPMYEGARTGRRVRIERPAEAGV